MGSCRKFARRFTEGIGKLARNVKEDCPKEDRKIYRKIIGGYRSIWESALSSRLRIHKLWKLDLQLLM
ncbi:hypothetical protein B296_00050440 [Ensete ventricosum]|uniref:Uncharacterized protein n=1 Tax=Ensete ventricosum TaxID=4639 RepID=A0A426WVW5_ENSVE|nr:hypothetical protein B296_00050440 [Ensete ventricosum]